MSLLLAPLRLQPLMRWLQKRQRANYSNVVAVTGPKGTGKSTLTLFLDLAMDPEFVPRESVFVRQEDYLRSIAHDIRAKRRGAVRHVDEGANIAYVLNFMTVESKIVKQIMLQNRELNSTEFWLMPHITDIDGKIVREQVNARIQMIDRARARIMRLETNERTGKTWWTQGPPFDVPNLATLRPDLVAAYMEVAGASKSDRILELIEDYFKRREQRDEARVRRRRQVVMDPIPLREPEA